jgi:hypothetical protein
MLVPPRTAKHFTFDESANVILLDPLSRKSIAKPHENYASFGLQRLHVSSSRWAETGDKRLGARVRAFWPPPIFVMHGLKERAAPTAIPAISSLRRLTLGLGARRCARTRLRRMRKIRPFFQNENSSQNLNIRRGRQNTRRGLSQVLHSVALV